ncbi:hypothetical protein N7490_002133 [Penicillium lividum]|nr:hypothetical protein N7490_002133 [Penicillium lividum]
MGGGRKFPFTNQRQHVISLLSSGSEDIWISPRSAAGDTVEDGFS